MSHFKHFTCPLKPSKNTKALPRVPVGTRYYLEVLHCFLCVHALQSATRNPWVLQYPTVFPPWPLPRTSRMKGGEIRAERGRNGNVDLRRLPVLETTQPRMFHLSLQVSHLYGHISLVLTLSKIQFLDLPTR